ncbi:tRNA-dihydrouridine synthase [Candidatus Vallotia tarda]|uniref:tRNA-dihydrouridine synthase n=1 Tax=Candidatus Vallotiella hemipterorum TaxID=1177213 RepID=UPI001C200E03
MTREVTYRSHYTKIRIGQDSNTRRSLTIKRIAYKTGISMLIMHGRTCADLYYG